jgi:hypothetical protein
LIHSHGRKVNQGCWGRNGAWWGDSLCLSR